MTSAKDLEVPSGRVSRSDEHSAVAAHTPGPWSAIGGGIVAPMVLTTLSSGRRVSFRVAVCKDGSRSQVSANVRLISTAPDLLEIAKRIVALQGIPFNSEERIAEGGRIMAMSKIAIAKAEERA